MSTSVIMLLMAAVVVIVVLVVASNNGPRVTRIDRTVHRERDQDDA